MRRFGRRLPVAPRKRETLSLQVMQNNQELFKMMLKQQNAIFYQLEQDKKENVEEMYPQEEFTELGGSATLGKRPIVSTEMKQGRKKRFKTASELGLKL